jgi:hypothetical protein
LSFIETSFIPGAPVSEWRADPSVGMRSQPREQSHVDSIQSHFGPDRVSRILRSDSLKNASRHSIVTAVQTQKLYFNAI